MGCRSSYDAGDLKKAAALYLAKSVALQYVDTQLLILAVTGGFMAGGYATAYAGTALGYGGPFILSGLIGAGSGALTAGTATVIIAAKFLNPYSRVQKSGQLQRILRTKGGMLETKDMSEYVSSLNETLCSI